LQQTVHEIEVLIHLNGNVSATISFCGVVFASAGSHR